MRYRMVTMVDEKKMFTRFFESISDDIAVGLAQNEVDRYVDKENEGSIFTYHLTLYKEDKKAVWLPIYQSMSNMLRHAVMKAMAEEPNVLILEDDTDMWR